MGILKKHFYTEGITARRRAWYQNVGKTRPFICYNLFSSVTNLFFQNKKTECLSEISEADLLYSLLGYPWKNSEVVMILGLWPSIFFVWTFEFLFIGYTEFEMVIPGFGSHYSCNSFVFYYLYPHVFLVLLSWFYFACILCFFCNHTPPVLPMHFCEDSLSLWLFSLLSYLCFSSRALFLPVLFWRSHISSALYLALFPLSCNL